MTINVTFCVDIREGDSFPCVSEDELKDKLDLYLGKLLKNLDTEGALIIQSPGLPDVRIQDAVPAIVHNLCFRAIPDLAAHKFVVIRVYSNYGYVRLDPEVSLVRVSGDGLPDVRMNRKELINALFDCGQRFFEFLRIIRGGDPDYEDILHGIEEDAARTESFLREPTNYREF